VAPNRFVLDWVNSKYLTRIERLVNEFNQGQIQSIGLSVRPHQAIASRERMNVVRSVNSALTKVAPQTGILNRYSVNPPASAAQLLAEDFPNAGADIAGNHQGVGGSHNSEDDWADFDWSEVQGQHDATERNGNEFQSPQSHSREFQAREIPRPETPTSDVKDPLRALSANSDSTLGEVAPFMGSAGHNSFTRRPEPRVQVEGAIKHSGSLNTSFTFKSFVEGKSNQLGLAAAQQVAENPGGAYNPLFIYGGVGLGKTHLMHAVGNAMLVKNPNAKVVYLHSERFVADMVKALQLNAINDFKRYYRSVDALLIDDIQFFSGKDRSQEEFFHTFNALLEGGQQIILTCDRYPKEIKNLEERLKSRFGWGLTVAVEPPELETRVAILKKKAVSVNMELPNEAAFFIAQRVRSNVRELEGALKRVIAHAHFTRRNIDVALVTEALKDLLALQSKQVSIDNIQRVVAEYFKIKVADLLSKRRSRSVARPRQVAMALAKELTNHSLPEIGDFFGGRDHTTVLHACRKIKELKEIDAEMQTDVKNLMRLLTT